MKVLLNIVLLLVFTTNLLAQFVDPETPEDAKPGSLTGEWELEFSDEFNGTEVDTEKWRIDNSTKSRAARPNIGIYDWRWKPENVKVENGNLVLEVHKTGENSMTNGSINSYTKYLTQYGYFEVRIKVGDASKGTHTAFWLQGPDMGTVTGNAHNGAEIDVFETAWTGDFTKSVVHIDGYGADHQGNTKRYETPGIHSGFHTWGFHWTEYFMDIYYDGVFKVRYADPKWIVKSPEFLWLSNGASFGLEGDQYFLDLPIGYLTQTEVDYIRVWKDVSLEDETLLSKDDWELIYANTEDVYGDHIATYAFDGNPFTFWHSEWKDNQPSHPHEIQIDLGGTARCYGFSYLPRQDNNPNGNIADYQLFASDDKDNWGDPVLAGTFGSDGTKKTVEFPDAISCRYIRFVALSEVNGNSLSNIAELSLKGEYITDTSLGEGKFENSSNILLFPNPFTEEVNMKIDDIKSPVNWKFYTIDGQLIKKGMSFNSVSSIETRELKPGLYFIEISSDHSTVIKKGIKR